MKIALIGFGEVGQILAEDLSGHDLAAFDILFADRASAASQIVIRVPVRNAPTAADAVRDVELVISAVTAANDLEAARSVTPGLSPNAVFLDLNSASPGQKRASAEVIEAAGGRYVEAAVMAPIGPKRIASPTLLGGPHAQAFEPVAQALGLTGARFYSADLGKASATKMCRSVMIKGVEALITESMLSARHYGVEKEVLASLSDLLPVGDWPHLAQYMIGRSIEHGVRRAEEMREVAKTVAEAGVEPLMSGATAQRQDWAAHHKQALTATSLPDMLDSIRSGADQ